MLRRILTLFAAAALAASAQDEAGFKPLCDGQTFAGWKASEATATWKVEDGAFVAHGNRSHLFYVGELQPFVNFELKIDCWTEPGSNGGIYVATKYQDTDWPKHGYEIQVNNTHSDPIKTASLYGVKNVMNASPAKDRQWWTQHIIVKGKTITVKVDGKTVNEFTEEPDRKPGKDFTRILSAGTFALQGHDPKSVVKYKNIRVKRLD